MRTRKIIGNRVDSLRWLVCGLAALPCVLAAGCATFVKPEAEPVPTVSPVYPPSPDTVAQGTPHPPEQGVRAAEEPATSLSKTAQSEAVRPSPQRAEVPVQRPQPAAEPQSTSTASPIPPAGPATKSETPIVKPVAAAPAKVVAKPVAPIEPPARSQSKAAVGDAIRTEAPALDLKALEKQLKETKAIGVFTKLSLKNQVDDLLDRFRAFYQGRLKTSLGELRQPYEGLMLKVISLLQDGDPPLARAIAASREGIWGILADPVKFAKVGNGS